MWRTMLLINSILLALMCTYLVYTFGAMILLLQWKQFLLVLMFCVFLILTQVALAAMAEP